MPYDEEADTSYNNLAFSSSIQIRTLEVHTSLGPIASI